MGRKNARAVFPERQSQSVEELVGAVPDVAIGADVELRLKLFCITQSNSAVHAVRCKQEIAVLAQ